MELIAVVDSKWGIGYKGDLQFCLPPDLRRFKELTMGNVLVMGRKTAESLPNGKALEGRVNIVLTRQMNYKMTNAIIVHDTLELFDVLKGYNDKKTFVIGGAEIYGQLINYCDIAHITYVKATAMADSYITDLGSSVHWQVMSHNENMQYNGMEYTYMVYQRVKDAI